MVTGAVQRDVATLPRMVQRTSTVTTDVTMDLGCSLDLLILYDARRAPAAAVGPPSALELDLDAVN